MDNEQSVRQLIEQMLTDWDNAFVQQNAQGILGHCVPRTRQQEEALYNGWKLFMFWIEDATAQTTLKQFHFNGTQATVVVEQQRSFCFRRPQPSYAPLGRALVGLASKFVIVERDIKRTEWNQTQEGWLCQSEKKLSYLLRIRRRPPVT